MINQPTVWACFAIEDNYHFTAIEKEKAMSASHPFDGILVVDFTHVLAGPACSYYLGLLGAEVIKIESEQKGDAIRHRGGTDEEAAKLGMSTSYLTQAAGKRSLTLDLESDQGLKLMHELLAKADILVENHIPETMRRLGLDETSLAARHPHLIHCAMTGYGRGGPQENTSAYDVNIQASCGLMEATGTLESGPMRTGAPVLDYATAMAAGFAVSAALFERAKTGRGSFVDVSMLETGLSLMSSSVTDFLKTGNAPRRRGNLANSRSPGAGSFACKEGVMSLGVNEESHFRSLAAALGRNDWLTDPKFAERSARKAHSGELVNQLEEELSKQTAIKWEPVLQSHGVPCARLRSLPEALDSVQVKQRGFVQTLPDGVSVPTLPFRLGGADAYVSGSSAPELGEHNDEIRQWLDRESQ
ncbi:MAG: CoA transferase [Rhizobiaceae bacterium]